MKLRELAEEVERRQAEAKTLAARARRLEVAINIKPLWIKRGKIDDQLERFANLRPLEEGTIAIARRPQHSASKSTSGNATSSKASGNSFATKPSGWASTTCSFATASGSKRCWSSRTGCRPSSAWPASWPRKSKQLEARLASENERLSHEWTGAGKLPPRITSDIVEQLTPQVRAIEATEQMLDSAKHELEVHRAGEHQYRSQIESAMTGGDKLGLPKDLDAAGDLVAQLRRRQQVEQRIEAARRQADDLQQQAQELVDEQVVPMGLFSWLLAVFVVGFVALGAWWLVPAADARQIRRLDRRRSASAARSSPGCSSISPKTRPPTASTPAITRSRLVLDQIDEAEEEQAQLDRELPLTEGSVATATAACRAAPGRAGARCCPSKASGARRPAKSPPPSAASSWPRKSTPPRSPIGRPSCGRWDCRTTSAAANLATMAGQCERLAELEARIENRRDDMARRQREFAVVSQRIFALAEETGCAA